MKPVNGDVYSDGLTAIYSCRTGFTMEGVEKRYCGTDGSGWNETEPTCSKFPLHEYVGKTYAVIIIQNRYSQINFYYHFLLERILIQYKPWHL